MTTHPPLPDPAIDMSAEPLWYTADQIHTYADTVLAAVRDCRTCLNLDWVSRSKICASTHPCTDGDKYAPLPPIRLWRKSE